MGHTYTRPHQTKEAHPQMYWHGNLRWDVIYLSMLICRRGRPGIGGAFELSWDVLYKYPLQGIRGCPKQPLNVSKSVLERSLKWSKMPTTGNQLLSNSLPMPPLSLTWIGALTFCLYQACRVLPPDRVGPVKFKCHLCGMVGPVIAQQFWLFLALQSI